MTAKMSLLLFTVVVLLSLPTLRCTRVALFHGRNLRLHDNPVLSRIGEGAVIPVFVDEDAGVHKAALDALNLEFQYGLAAFLQKHSGIKAVHYSPHSDAVDASILQACTAAKVPAVLASDSFLMEDQERLLVAQLDAARRASDMSFSALGRYSFLSSKVAKPDMVSHTKIDLPRREQQQHSDEVGSEGERLALFLIAEYVRLGDVDFTRKYAQHYVEAVARSSELRRSLLRLFPDGDSSEGPCLNRGEVLSGLLSPLIAQGCVSLRLLVHARTAMPGWLSRPELLCVERPLECQLKAEAVRKHWHGRLATAQLGRRDGAWTKTEYSAWRGYLYRHATMLPLAGRDESDYAFILLHGFGGSVDQYTALGQALAKRGHTSFAVDSLGFGSAEKAPLSFNQYTWRDHALEHIEQLTIGDGAARGKKIVLVGNSIGGFCAASSAAVLRDKCHALVLLNSAGRLLEEDPNPKDSGFERSFEPADAEFLFAKYKGPKPYVLSLFGKLIFLLLQPNIRRTTEWLYPINPQHVAASNLAPNILRDSQDPGASEVIAAGGKLPTPRSMDGLFRDFGGRVLVAQGAKDPLNDSPTRAAIFGRISEQVTVDLLDLGHCPHDEGAELVADSMLQWLGK